MLSVVMLSVAFLLPCRVSHFYSCTECRYAECRSAFQTPFCVFKSGTLSKWECTFTDSKKLQRWRLGATSSDRKPFIQPSFRRHIYTDCCLNDRVIATVDQPLLRCLSQICSKRFCPNTFCPIVFCPNVYCPNVFCPNDFSTNVFCPNVFCPNVFCPNVFCPNVFCPNVFCPNVFCTNVFQPAIYRPIGFKLKDIES
jgi:hypothetical protein